MTYSPECVAEFEAKFGKPPIGVDYSESYGGYLAEFHREQSVADACNDQLAAFAANWERVKELEERLKYSEAAANCLARQLESVNSGQTITVRYDLSPASAATEIRNKLIEMGWTPPQTTGERQ